MKTFEMPNIEVIAFEVKDIITASQATEDPFAPDIPIDPELPGDDFE